MMCSISSYAGLAPAIYREPVCRIMTMSSILAVSVICFTRGMTGESGGGVYRPAPGKAHYALDALFTGTLFAGTAQTSTERETKV